MRTGRGRRREHTRTVSCSLGRMYTTQRFVVRMRVLVTGLAVVTAAKGDPVGTPVGPMDRSCVHQMSSGAVVDMESGDISLDGALVDHHAPCVTKAPPALSAMNKRAAIKGATAGGWYDFSMGAATTIRGLTQFNSLAVQWTVPPAPNDSPSDTSVLYLFPALQNLGNPSDVTTWYSILQPILQWGYNNLNGGKYWQIEAMFCLPHNQGCQTGTPVRVAPGDVIQGYIYQYALDPDSWTVFVWDETEDTISQLSVAMPRSWPKYNLATMGALEAYGDAAESRGLNSCSELPNAFYDVFTSLGLYEAGPAWNSSNDACSLVSWGYYADPYSYIAPACSWGIQANGCGAPSLIWVP